MEIVARIAIALVVAVGGGLASLPANALVELNGIGKIAAGGAHTCALTTGGGVKCWGLNENGQLGDNSTTLRLLPVDVSGLAGGLAAIAAGRSHTCALTTGGGVKCWGNNSNGQLGDNTTTQRLVPVGVLGLMSGVAAIAAGGFHTCALTTGGGVKCWGNNSNGQLGFSTTTQRLAPVDVQGLASGVTAIVASDAYTCALTTGGGVKCWGYNNDGQLGDNTLSAHSVPIDVSGLASGVVAIAAGSFYHTCAITTGGGVKCWGNNVFAQLGDNTTINRRLAPVDVTGLASGVAAIAGGDGHTCALTTGGGVKCWGLNYNGQVGDNTTSDRPVPVDVAGLGSGVAAISAGYYHTCALTNNGNAKCWGNNLVGQLGDNTPPMRLAPVDVSRLSNAVAAIAAGDNHTCALTTGGGVKCWGSNDVGQLGDNTATTRPRPVDVSGLASGVAAIATGSAHTCALTAGGSVKCWGFNALGQLGDNSTTNRLVPVDVSGLASGVTAIAAGGVHTCALTASGVKCWGINSDGQLGDNSTTSRSVPVEVTGLARGVLAIAAGGSHTCALTSGRGVKCWGSNAYGQLGDNTTTRRLVPIDVPGLASGVTAIAASTFHTCALTTGGGVKCWGSNSWGQLGDNSNTTRLAPVEVSGLASGVAAIAAGSLYHTCALMTGGGVKCWGANVFGQLGDGTAGIRPFPAGVQTSSALANYTDLWWNPTESGWGINLNQQEDLMFATLFTYDAAGRDWWLVASGMQQQPDGSFTGPLYETHGPPFFTTPWTAFQFTPVGSINVRFPTPSTGSLSYTVNGVTVNKQIERQRFGVAPSCELTALSRDGATNFQDLWWNPNEAGWGVNLTHQGESIFASLFTYDTDRKAMWLVASDLRKQTDGSYLGDLFRTRGPAFNASPFAGVTLQAVGAMRLRFTNGNNGTLSYNVGDLTVERSITRQVFGTSVTVCR